MGDKSQYWECKTIFPPQNLEIELFVDGGRDELFDTQHRFFQNLCKSWDVVSDRIEPKLRECFQQANQKRLDWDEFTVSSVSIPREAIESAEWTLGLNAKSDLQHDYWVDLKGLEPATVSSGQLAGYKRRAQEEMIRRWISLVPS